MKKFAAVLCVLCSFGMPIPVSAQDDCSAVLGSVSDKSSNSGSTTNYSSFKRFFCDQTFSSYQKARDAGFSVGVIIESLPISFSGHDRETSWNEYRRSVCESIETFQFFNTTWKTELSRANSEVVTAWSACVAAQGLHFWAEVNESDPGSLTLVARYIHEGPPHQTKITEPISFSAKGVTCPTAGSAFKKNALISAQRRVDCSRENEETATNITLHTENGDRTVRLVSARPLSMGSPSIAKGVFIPNAIISVDTDHGPLSFSHTAPLSTFPISATGPSLPHPPLGTYAQAIYDADVKTPDASPDHAAASVHIHAKVGGVCGAGANGGSGGLNPSWSTSMQLPRRRAKSSKERPPVWQVKFNSDIALHGIPGGRCIVTVDGALKDLAIAGKTELEFVLDPGEHSIAFYCSGPNPFFGCYGHAGGVNEGYQDLTYDLGIDAKPVTVQATLF
jgi:hypothetical protein